MSDPWFKFYPSDWLGGTRALTAAETGVYITLVCMMHESGKPVVMEDDRLARLCGLPTRNLRRALVSLKDLGKITEKDGGLWNERVSETLNERQKLVSVKTQAAVSRWEKTKEKQCAEDADALHTHTDTRSQIPDSSDTNVSDLASLIFSKGVAFLVAQKIPERQARSLLGKWRSLHGDEAVIAALGRAQRENALDAVAFIEGCFRFKPKASGSNWRDDIW